MQARVDSNLKCFSFRMIINNDSFSISPPGRLEGSSNVEDNVKHLIKRFPLLFSYH